MSLLSEDLTIFTKYLIKTFDLSEHFSIYAGSLMIEHNVSKFKLSENKVQYLLFNFLGQKESIKDLQRLIYKTEVESIISSLYHTANSIRDDLNTEEGADQIGLITPYKEQQRLLASYGPSLVD